MVMEIKRNQTLFSGMYNTRIGMHTEQQFRNYTYNKTKKRVLVNEKIETGIFVMRKNAVSSKIEIPVASRVSSDA